MSGDCISLKKLPDPIAQSVASPIADSEVRSLILVLPDTCTFVETDSSTVVGICKRKYVQRSSGKQLSLSLSRKKCG